MAAEQAHIMAAKDLDRLLELLQGAGRMVMGPILRHGALAYGRVGRAGDLATGWREEQEPGRSRGQATDSPALFGHHPGQESWKQFFFPPDAVLLRAHRVKDSWALATPPDETPPLALLGVRPCELAAIQVQDKVLMDGPYADPLYQARRESAFIVAVNCTAAGPHCFCASMGAGPRAESGYDLALTEIEDADGHRLVVEQGSDQGQAILDKLALDPAGDDLARARELCAAAARNMGRSIDPQAVAAGLKDNLARTQWADVASRCLNCGNCTLVCPTCFCCTVKDGLDLGGQDAERRRLWDSCFAPDHSYIHGGDIRTTPAARYRQWLTHKLLWWQEQFGVSGCVGCGRCITWCPVGIDLTQEAAAILGDASTGRCA